MRARRALMKGVGSVRRYGKEWSEMRQRGDVGFANKANQPDLPHRGERAAPPPTPPRDSGRREGRRRGVGGGKRETRTSKWEGWSREGGGPH